MHTPQRGSGEDEEAQIEHEEEDVTVDTDSDIGEDAFDTIDIEDVERGTRAQQMRPPVGVARGADGITDNAGGAGAKSTGPNALPVSRPTMSTQAAKSPRPSEHEQAVVKPPATAAPNRREADRTVDQQARKMEMIEARANKAKRMASDGKRARRTWRGTTESVSQFIRERADVLVLSGLCIVGIALFFAGCFTRAPTSNFLLFFAFVSISMPLAMCVYAALNRLALFVSSGSARMGGPAAAYAVCESSPSEAAPTGEVFNAHLPRYFMRHGRFRVLVLLTTMLLIVLVAWAIALFPGESNIPSLSYDSTLRVGLMVFIAACSATIAFVVERTLVLATHACSYRDIRRSIRQELAIIDIAAQLRMRSAGSSGGSKAAGGPSPTRKQVLLAGIASAGVVDKTSGEQSASGDGGHGAHDDMAARPLLLMLAIVNADLSRNRDTGASNTGVGCTPQELIEASVDKVHQRSLAVTTTAAAAAEGDGAIKTLSTNQQAVAFGRDLFAQLSSCSPDGAVNLGSFRAIVNESTLLSSRKADEVFGLLFGDAHHDNLCASDVEAAIVDVLERRTNLSRTLACCDSIVVAVGIIVRLKLAAIDLVLLLIVVRSVDMTAIAVVAAALAFVLCYCFGSTVRAFYTMACVICLAQPFGVGDCIALKDAVACVDEDELFIVRDIGCVTSRLQTRIGSSLVHVPTDALCRMVIHNLGATRAAGIAHLKSQTSLVASTGRVAGHSPGAHGDALVKPSTNGGGGGAGGSSPTAPQSSSPSMTTPRRRYITAQPE